MSRTIAEQKERLKDHLKLLWDLYWAAQTPEESEDTYKLIRKYDKELEELYALV